MFFLLASRTISVSVTTLWILTTAAAAGLSLSIVLGLYIMFWQYDDERGAGRGE